eukprot:Platyproteum_vivax@DN5083_c0_g2_i1.p1
MRRPHVLCVDTAEYMGTLENYVKSLADGSKYIFKRVPENQLKKLSAVLLKMLELQEELAVDKKAAGVHITMKPVYFSHKEKKPPLLVLQCSNMLDDDDYTKEIVTVLASNIRLNLRTSIKNTWTIPAQERYALVNEDIHILHNGAIKSELYVAKPLTEKEKWHITTYPTTEPKTDINAKDKSTTKAAEAKEVEKEGGEAPAEDKSTKPAEAEDVEKERAEAPAEDTSATAPAVEKDEKQEEKPEEKNPESNELGEGASSKTKKKTAKKKKGGKADAVAPAKVVAVAPAGKASKKSKEKNTVKGNVAPAKVVALAPATKPGKKSKEKKTEEGNGAPPKVEVAQATKPKTKKKKDGMESGAKKLYLQYQRTEEFDEINKSFLS